MVLGITDRTVGRYLIVITLLLQYGVYIGLYYYYICLIGVSLASIRYFMLYGLRPDPCTLLSTPLFHSFTLEVVQKNVLCSGKNHSTSLAKSQHAFLLGRPLLEFVRVAEVTLRRFLWTFKSEYRLVYRLGQIECAVFFRGSEKTLWLEPGVFSSSGVGW